MRGAVARPSPKVRAVIWAVTSPLYDVLRSAILPVFVLRRALTHVAKLAAREPTYPKARAREYLFPSIPRKCSEIHSN